MFNLSWTLSATLALLMTSSPVLSQVSGSDGSDGAIDVTEDTTLPLPPGGIINATTVTVAQGVTLRFASNELNTGVHLLATGDIVVEGDIVLNGEPGNATGGGAGGPGGFAGGSPGINGAEPSAGLGPGAGLGSIDDGTTFVGAGLAAYGGLPSSNISTNGNVYGSPLLVPLVGGSGGGGAAPRGTVSGGGGGGGAILLASDTLVAVTGRVFARGGAPTGNGSGSGGAIRIVAPVVAGSGSLDVRGGQFSLVAGHGRIRIDTIDLADVNFGFTPVSAVSLGSFLVAIPPGLPRLDIVSVAGEAVAEGTPSSVDVILPFNTPNDQTLTVSARDFTGIVPIRVVVTPQNGVPIVTDTEIDMSQGNPAELTVPLDLPQNVRVKIQVFTRDA